jgi:hypothetical protein
VQGGFFFHPSAEDLSLGTPGGKKPQQVASPLHPLENRYADQPRSRRLLASTQTELNAMAAAASQGVSRMWKAG